MLTTGGECDKISHAAVERRGQGRAKIEPQSVGKSGKKLEKSFKNRLTTADRCGKIGVQRFERNAKRARGTEPNGP